MWPLLVCLVVGQVETREQTIAAVQKELGGEINRKLAVGTICDLLTDTHAIEFADAANWHTALGQSLYNAMSTAKRPGVVLRGTDRKADVVTIGRCTDVAAMYGVTVWVPATRPRKARHAAARTPPLALDRVPWRAVQLAVPRAETRRGEARTRLAEGLARRRRKGAASSSVKKFFATTLSPATRLRRDRAPRNEKVFDVPRAVRLTQRAKLLYLAMKTQGGENGETSRQEWYPPTVAT
jgi:hypothetical protein